MTHLAHHLRGVLLQEDRLQFPLDVPIIPLQTLPAEGGSLSDTAETTKASLNIDMALVSSS